MAKIHHGVRTSRKQGGPKMANIQHGVKRDILECAAVSHSPSPALSSWCVSFLVRFHVSSRWSFPLWGLRSGCFEADSPVVQKMCDKLLSREVSPRCVSLSQSSSTASSTASTNSGPTEPLRMNSFCRAPPTDCGDPRHSLPLDPRPTERLNTASASTEEEGSKQIKTTTRAAEHDLSKC